MLDRFLFLIAEGFRNLLRHKLTVFAAVFSVFMTMIIIGSLLIIGKNTNKLIFYLRSKYNLLQWARSYHGRNGWALL